MRSEGQRLQVDDTHIVFHRLDVSVFLAYFDHKLAALHGFVSAFLFHVLDFRKQYVNPQAAKEETWHRPE